MTERLALGIDFGGTKILAGIVNIDTGKILAIGKKKSKPQEDIDVVQRISSVIAEALADGKIDRKKIIGIGIGVAGMVDREKGVVLNAVNLGLKNFSLTQPLSKKFDGIPCRVGNDVEVATLAELHFGAGRGCRDFICIFVGTGIGSGVVFDGKQYRGFTGTAGEIGHIVLQPGGRPCACGAMGCLETYASRTAIAKQILHDINRGFVTGVLDKVDMNKGILRSRTIAEAVAAKDDVVTRAVEDAAKYMGMGLATVTSLINPQRIILGGGLVEAVDYYFERSAAEALYRSLPIATNKIEILKAQLGDYAGIVGAALLVK